MLITCSYRVGGGVSNYTENVRLGDVVLSTNTNNSQEFIYQYHQAAKVRQGGEVAFETKSWNPKETTLQLIGKQLAGQVSLAD